MKRSQLAGALGLGTCVIFSAAATSSAALVHRYSFNDGTDSVGGVNGTANGAATIANGTLTTPATGNTVNDSFHLPAAVGTGITGDFTIEDFLTVPTDPQNYSTLFSFSNSQTNFLLANANRVNTTGLSIDFDVGPNGSNEINVVGPNPLPAGSEVDLAISYVAASGLVNVSVNGASVATGTVPGFNFATTSNGAFDGINGQSPFTGDNSPGASTDEFRIYNTALSQAQIAADFTAGPNSVPEPASLSLLGLAGGAALIRRRNRSR